ncbi:MAG: cob(I)yrinic acid a,c-diamide adenosyltransferase [Candidatus Omnitrophica bacterium]|nr:cob(I)yrinic acid a,c-diamide adenosyltransferase [Candidatus Omnitrophota bacterium]
MKKGLVHVYTGDGKGKTTAAFGLAARAAGAGFDVCIYQFIKGMPYSENDVFKKIGNVTIEQCGRGCFIRGTPKAEDIKCAAKALEKARAAVRSGRYDLVVLDEVNVAMRMKLVKAADIISLMKGKPDSVELVLTGRYCPKNVLARADLVTEMKKVKHPYDKGVKARKGIEY